MSAKLNFDMGSLVRHAADCRPPIEGDQYCIAVTDAATSVALTDDLRDCYSRWLADGNDVYIIFGTNSGVEADNTAVAGDGRCDQLVDGIAEYLLIASSDALSHFSVKTASGLTAKLRYRPASHVRNS